jgi:cell wall-associated NlpC family hydrolase
MEALQPSGRTSGSASASSHRALPRVDCASLRLALALATCCGACDREEARSTSERATPCTAEAWAPVPLPGVDPGQLRLAYWLERLSSEHDLDEVVLARGQIRALNAALATPRQGVRSRRDLLEPADLTRLADKVEERLSLVRGRLRNGTYLRPDGRRVTRAELGILSRRVPLEGVAPELRVALAESTFRCTPTQQTYLSESMDPRLDHNSCGALRAQEVLRLIARWPNGMQLAQNRYAFGWLPADVELSPPIPQDLQRRLVRGPRVQLLADAVVRVDTGHGVAVPAGTLLPAAREGAKAYIATPRGFVTAGGLPLRATERALTRRALLEDAWRYVGTPYGRGGTGGGRDCSRFLLDVFASFDLHLPRNSEGQSLAGVLWVDIGEDMGEARRLRLIDAASRRGVVLLYLPGHIMLYLGRDDRGRPMVLHALAEYMRACPAGTVPERESGETRMKVRGVTVSGLGLGRGTSRRALIERITRIAVYGRAPGPELAGVAQAGNSGAAFRQRRGPVAE